MSIAAYSITDLLVDEARSSSALRTGPLATMARQVPDVCACLRREPSTGFGHQFDLLVLFRIPRGACGSGRIRDCETFANSTAIPQSPSSTPEPQDGFWTSVVPSVLKQSAARGGKRTASNSQTTQPPRPAARGLNVATGTLASARFPGESFDAITFWGVLEHLRDPLATLILANKLLARDGILTLSTP